MSWLVPEVAIGYDQLGSYLMIVDEKSKVERRNVKTGTQVETFRVIAEGLSGNEWVVVKGIQRAIGGRQVAPEKETLAPPPPPCPPSPTAPTKARP